MHSRRRAAPNRKTLTAVGSAVLAGLMFSILPGSPVAAAPPAVEATASGISAVQTTTDDPIAHDPTMIKQGKYYYVAITGDAGTANTYLPMKRSKNLKDWEELPPVFTTAPQWIVDTLGTTPSDFWAPELVFANGEYRLYYAASQFATNNSVIALATSKSLDPSSADYGWVDRGLVLRSTTADTFNAIDPDVTVDADGRSWLAYGSFWSGISIKELDSGTGALLPGATPTHLIDRQWAPNAVEAPAITFHDGFYYLFASFDYCCRAADSEYRTIVGRSTDITGPYVDRSGQALLNGGGTELLRGYNEFVGPGGGDIVVDGRTTRYVHHYYDAADGYVPKLSVREVEWDADGWPSFSEPTVPSVSAGHGPAYFSIVEKTSGAAVGTVPGGASAPLCGYEGADIRLLSDDANPCASWRFDPSDDGDVALRNQQTNKVAEAAACGTGDGTDVAQWGWLHNDCQLFRVVAGIDGWVSLENKAAPGKVLDAGTTCAGGSNVALWSSDAARCQQFRLQPNGAVLIVSASSGEPLATCASTRSQCGSWRFEHTTDGYYRVTNEVGRALPIHGCGSGACSEWRLVPTGSGSFQLADRATGHVLTDTGRRWLELTPSTDAAAQRFMLTQP